MHARYYGIFRHEIFHRRFIRPTYTVTFVHFHMLTDTEDKRKNATARIKLNKFRQQTECNLLKATFRVRSEINISRAGPLRDSAEVQVRHCLSDFRWTVSFASSNVHLNFHFACRYRALKAPHAIRRLFALNKADEEKKGEEEKEKPEERQNAREGIRTFKMRYFIVASLAVKRAPRASTVKKTKTTTPATATAMKRAVGP